MLGKPISPSLQGKNKATVDGWTDGCMDGWMEEDKERQKG